MLNMRGEVLAGQGDWMLGMWRPGKSRWPDVMHAKVPTSQRWPDARREKVMVDWGQSDIIWSEN